MSKDTDDRAFFNTREVIEILKITKQDLYHVMRPVRTKMGLEPPLFQPECKSLNVGHSTVFSQKDIVTLHSYFSVHKEFKKAEERLEAAKAKLRRQSQGKGYAKG